LENNDDNIKEYWSRLKEYRSRFKRSKNDNGAIHRPNAVVRVAHGETEPWIIGRGFRQGCPLSPQQFNIYAEKMMEDAMTGIDEGVKIGGALLKDIRFADDQAMVASTQEGLQKIMDALYITVKEYKMKINISKTKIMVITKSGKKKAEIFVEGKVLEQVKKIQISWSLDNKRWKN